MVNFVPPTDTDSKVTLHKGDVVRVGEEEFVLEVETGAVGGLSGGPDSTRPEEQNS